MANPQLTAYISLVTTSGVLILLLFIYSFVKRKQTPFAYTFMLFTAAQCVYVFGHAFELASNTLEQIKHWTMVEYAGMPFAAALGLIVIMKYIGKTVSTKTGLLMCVIPFISFLMVLTNDYHHLFYKGMYLRADAPSPMADVSIGQWYIVHGAYTFGCLFTATTLLVRRWRSTKKAYRFQLATLIISQLLPMSAAFVYLLGITPYGMDPVPITMCVTASLFIWSIAASRLLTIVPIAKESIFESMREGVIVLDANRRIIDYNHAVKGMVPLLHSGVIGTSMDDVWPRLTGRAFPDDVSVDGLEEEVHWPSADGLSSYQARISLVTNKKGDAIGMLLMLIDVTEQRMLQEQLKKLAYYDGLTGIYNRTQFLVEGRALLEEAGGKPVSLILFDIDHFKQINDTYGHETGDQALKHIVSVCQRFMLPEMPFARYGGEEFVIALPSAKLSEAVRLAEDICKALQQNTLHFKGNAIDVTSSFGVVQQLSDTETLEAILRRADEALYTSKKEGRNRVTAAA
ncbi:diguanylate cyclase (GGDEF)-like protein [Paenibacillus cellulosilyticus]|uniref:Diguanylate cyclase (GGDEF)-like protein n=1 Tax=Paenibacillus cellulosilyticus TaxID=375489 RepID=A0A2V2Z1L2_9BACL|nr:histidine kinase N-terminal 7TM domain-containing protein [Paenibacillus cellulosilyticus]PWW08732.1 diguanylate cyclase (GGDEF)-like protein [Paenibacillus cellulosilyticus]QKS48295.1 diguanylate cyclase [Paenibacillus cellulosilyticus]